jgi:hypothetical protein
MGPVLKTLLGLYLFLWTVIGIVVIAGGFVVASKLPELKENMAGLSQLLGNTPQDATGIQNQNSGAANQLPAGVTAEMQACVEEALGKDEMENLKSQNGQPSEAQRQAFEKCGFKPNNQAGQQSTQPVGTPPNDAEAGFPPAN